MRSCTKTSSSRFRRRCFFAIRNPPVRNRTLAPHPLERRLIFKNIGREDWTIDIDCYLQAGGYEQLEESGHHVAAPTS